MFLFAKSGSPAKEGSCGLSHQPDGDSSSFRLSLRSQGPRSHSVQSRGGFFPACHLAGSRVRIPNNESMPSFWCF